MGFIGGIAVFILLMILLNKASKACYKWASALEKKEQTEAFYKESLLSSVQGIEKSMSR